jgi:hypothetical protein
VLIVEDCFCVPSVLLLVAYCLLLIAFIALACDLLENTIKRYDPRNWILKDTGKITAIYKNMLTGFHKINQGSTNTNRSHSSVRDEHSKMLHNF